MPSEQATEDLPTLGNSEVDCSARRVAEKIVQPPDHLLSKMAELHMANERWAQAAEVFDRLIHRDSESELRRKLCRNLAAIQVHRPHAYGALIGTEPNDRYSLTASKTGHPTVVYLNDRGARVTMSADNDPLGSVQRAMTSIDAAYRGGKAIGLSGIGDGYLLQHLARNPPELILGREQAICLFEPEAPLVLACLMLHDYTSPAGPIEQQRFSWYVGPQWIDHFREEFLGDLFRMYPGVIIRTGLQAATIEGRLAEFLKEIAALDDRFVNETKAHYEKLTRDELLALFGTNPPRRPRVLVLTTRFSTVLQYSASDTAEAFAQLGWDAKLLIEPGSSHGLNRIAIRQAVAQFKPDLVFQIDHLRSEYGEMFHPNLPAICWIQDHLANLINNAAAASVTIRDFILTNTGHRYAREYGYPPRQLLHMTKATKPLALPKQWRRDRDIIFVSNAGRLPDEIVGQTLSRIAPTPERDLIRAIMRRMIDFYATGQCLETLVDLDGFVQNIELENRLVLGNGETRKQMIQLLWHPLNDALYRQQGLAWVADAADKLGLRLELYGLNWEKHPRFAPYSKGYVKYGRDLEGLTRQSRISLHVAPFSWLHQRVMDGYLAGGFFLIRRHPSNFVPYNLHRLIARQGRGEMVDRSQLNQLVDAYRRLNEISDPIEHVRQLADDDALHELPLMDTISFANANDCEAMIAKVIADPELAERTAAVQRQYVVEHFTYQSQMNRIIGQVAELIRKEAV